MRGRPWTEEEDDALRAGYAGCRLADLAADLGRTEKSLQYRAKALGVRHREPVDAARVVALAGEGRTDAEIAAACGTTAHYVRHIRQRRGVPANRPERTPEARAAARARTREQMRRQLAEAGVSHLRHLGAAKAAERRAALPRRHGLPEDLKAMQVRILLALRRSPATAERLRDELKPGSPDPYHAFNSPLVGGGNYLADLRRRGLVAAIPKRRAGGRGRAPLVYVPSLAALRMMAGAPAREGA